MRKATIEDAPRILEMLMAYYIERKPKNVDFNVFKVRRFLEVALTHPIGICFVADDGFIMGEMAPAWFSDTVAANGVAWYVKPEARKGPLPVRLFRMFQREGKAKGAKYLRFDFDNSVNLREGHSNLYMKEI